MSDWYPKLEGKVDWELEQSLRIAFTNLYALRDHLNSVVQSIPAPAPSIVEIRNQLQVGGATSINLTGLPGTVVNESQLTLTDVLTDNVSSTRHGFAPKSPSDPKTFLNGDTTPAYAQVKDSDLATTNVTDNNVTSTKHGFAPKSPADATQFLNGDVTPIYAKVKDSDLSTSAISTNDVSDAKHGFAPIAPGNIYKFLNGGATPDYTYPLINYGSMYADESAITVAILGTSTYVPVGSGLSDGGTIALAFTFQNASELKCLVAGKYLVSWSASINCATNSQDLSGCVMVNTTAQLNTTNHCFNGSGASKNASIAGTGIVTLAANDLLRISFANHTAIHDVLVEHVNLTAIRIG